METRQEILAALQELESSRVALEEMLSNHYRLALSQLAQNVDMQLSEEGLKRYELLDYFQGHGGIPRPYEDAYVLDTHVPVKSRQGKPHLPAGQAGGPAGRAGGPAGQAGGPAAGQPKEMRKPTKPAQHFALKTDHTKIWSARGSTPLWLRDACDAAGFDWSKKEGRLLFAQAHMEPVGMPGIASTPKAPIDPTPLPIESLPAGQAGLPTAEQAGGPAEQAGEEDFAAAA